MAAVVRAENLSKLYYLGGARHNSVRDAVMSFVKKPTFSKKKNELWALRDVSFSLEEGETLGIVGSNGAGKSTLLKILSRITKPTGGTVELHGRVGSLLEVGTGFHSELSGRENIYLNGALLGMRRAEIEKKFDEIVAFSEVEKFLDTPIKAYSTGMYMRLAFAVAAHLEPDILIVDEVLAVGDLAFQRKCLNKMRDVSEQGRTVIFVSHNMQAVTRLCHRAIWIESGRVRADAAAGDVVADYLSSQTETASERNWTNLNDAPGNDVVKLRRVRVINESGETEASFDVRRPIIIETVYEVLQPGQVLMPSFQIYNEEGICVFTSQDLDETWRYNARLKGIYTSRATIPADFLAEGNFFVTVSLMTYEPVSVHVYERDVTAFIVTDSFDGASARGDTAGHIDGIVRPLLSWETDLEEKG